MTTLRDRCWKFYQKLQRDAQLQQGSPIDDLVAFVIAEEGRSTCETPPDTLPLCLYFGSVQAREEFIEVFCIIEPTVIAKRMP
jgi:hypothetical protein